MTLSKRLLFILPLLLAACGGNNTVAPGRAGDDMINWVNDPSHIVFQIDVVGGPDQFEERNDVPLCTIYGDSRIVWTADSQPGQTIVLFDILDPVRVRDFILGLTENYNIYDYESLIDRQSPTEEQPVYEQITVNVNNTQHTTDGFDDWPTDYFREILQECRNLSQQPARFEPTGGWMDAAYADYDPDATIIDWNADASGINLFQLVESDEMLWIDNDVLPFLWYTMVNSPRNRLFMQNDQAFQVSFQVPNVHRNAPPAPSEEELPEARTLPIDE